MAKKPNISKILNVFGNVLILVSLIFLYLTFAPVIKEEVKYQKREVFHQVPVAKDLTPPNKNFSIVIPKIGAVAPIYANIDPFNEKEYLSILHKGVAQARGTKLPGEEGNVYLFAHSTDAFYNVGRYNAVFYLLGKLKKGDEIQIFYKGREIKYSVSEVKVVSADSVKYLGTIGGGKTLTLQTCYPPGTTIERLIVVANQVE